MEVQVSPQAQNHNLPIRKSLSGGYQKDLWLVVLEGSVADVDATLILLKKSGGNINARNAFGLTPLHIATWRNHIPIVRKLLAAGADPDARDGESGWSSLHRALHFGHITVASILLQSGASITLEDSKYRTPLDLLSAPLLQAVDQEHHSVTEIYSWGSGANYQLGTGNAHIQKLPCKIDSLHGYLIKFISAAKFHSVAVTTDGKLFTWGFGRGGRLGHPDFDIHSGQAAVITPRQVISGLGPRRVKAVATAKHHTVIATESGEVFTWGSNREGQLGYTSVDTQPTPRRVSSLRSKIIAVAAANKHTAVVSELGEVFTWGCNREGQLGYGTSNSASNYTPHVVEYLKGKVFAGVSASKYHTLVLGADGEAYTWGHRLVSPRRVVIARNLKKSGNVPLKFHRMKRLRVVAIAAGVVHSMALIDDGALFCWVSSDPDLKCQQLYSMCGKNIVSISAGKYWTAAVTSTGDVYMWDGKKGKDKPLVANRLHGVKRATSVAVGETHLLIVNSLYHPTYPSYVPENSENLKLIADDDGEELSEDLTFSDMDSIRLLPSTDQKDNPLRCSIPSLKSLCEKAAAECLVEPRNAIQMLEIADSLEADGLRKHCEDIVLRNLDYIFMVSSNAIASAAPDLLVNLEKLLDQRSSEPWSHRRIPTPTATLPAITNNEGEDIVECERTRDDNMRVSALKLKKDRKLESFLQPKIDPNQGIMREVRALRKKLQQIEMLEAKQFDGHPLDGQQILKLRSKSVIENSLAELGAPVEPSQGKGASSVPTDGNVSKKAELSRKRRNDKTRGLQIEVTSVFSRNQGILDPVKGSCDSELLRVSETKDEDVKSEQKMANQFEKKQPVLVQDKDSSALLKNNSQARTASKKKSKKGGLSMFLSGALDDAPKEIAPPPSPIPKIERPAWGGAKMAKGLSSLREIQDEQKKIKGNQFTENNDHVEQHSDRTSGKVLLSSFLPSSPIPVTSTLTSVASVASDGDRGTPPWAASGTPPLLSRPSLRDIQMQQEKKQLSLSNSPKTKVAGFSITSGQGSPSESNVVNRWFKPEIDMPSSIRSIQIEEKAIKDLKRFYSTVKIVKNQS